MHVLRLRSRNFHCFEFHNKIINFERLSHLFIQTWNVLVVFINCNVKTTTYTPIECVNTHRTQQHWQQHQQQQYHIYWNMTDEWWTHPFGKCVCFVLKLSKMWSVEVQCDNRRKQFFFSWFLCVHQTKKRKRERAEERRIKEKHIGVYTHKLESALEKRLETEKSGFDSDLHSLNRIFCSSYSINKYTLTHTTWLR